MFSIWIATKNQSVNLLKKQFLYILFSVRAGAGQPYDCVGFSGFGHETSCHFLESQTCQISPGSSVFASGRGLKHSGPRPCRAPSCEMLGFPLQISVYSVPGWHNVGKFVKWNPKLSSKAKWYRKRLLMLSFMVLRNNHFAMLAVDCFVCYSFLVGFLFLLKLACLLCSSGKTIPLHRPLSYLNLI